MRSSQNSKYVTHIENGAVSTFTASVDTKGFGYAQVIWCSTVAGTAGTACAIEQGDDNSTWATIPGATANTDWTVSGSSIATTQPKIVLNLDLRGRKRYLKFTGIAPAARHTVTWALSSPSDGITNATDSGVTNHFNL